MTVGFCTAASYSLDFQATLSHGNLFRESLLDVLLEAEGQCQSHLSLFVTAPLPPAVLGEGGHTARRTHILDVGNLVFRLSFWCVTNNPRTLRLQNTTTMSSAHNSASQRSWLGWAGQGGSASRGVAGVSPEAACRWQLG